MYMHASYIYISMSYYFSRDDVALENFSRFFHKRSLEEWENAEKLMSYQNQHGGRILLKDIKRPEKDDWTNGLVVLELALQLEKNVNQSLLDLLNIAANKKYPQVIYPLHVLLSSVVPLKSFMLFLSRASFISLLLSFQMCDFLEREFLDEQVQAIKKLGDFVTNLKRLGVPGNGVGEYLFDKLTLKD
uniref:Ferritin n=1 Tax=Eptatretus burgeri TaxID=7764 RepID=A0A8C4R4N3_EPTBU